MDRLLHRFRLAHKLAMLGIVAMTIVALLFAIQVRSAIAALRTVDSEIDGLAPAQALLEVVRLTQQHRGLSVSVLGGKADAEVQRAARQKEVDQAMQAFDAWMAKDVDSARLRTDWKGLQQRWAALSKSVAERQIDGRASGISHTALIQAQLELNDRLADHFGLTLDPEAETYFLVVASLQQMPKLAELMGQARALGALVLARQNLNPDERARLTGLLAQVEAQLREMQLTLQKAFEGDPHGDTQLSIGDATEQAIRQTQAMAGLAQAQILDAQALTYPSADYFKATTAAIDSVFALGQRARQALVDELTRRQSDLRRQQVAVVILVLGLIGLGLWLGWAIARSITRAAASACQTARRIAGGDLSSPVPTGGQDEMGELLEAMRQMQARLADVVAKVRTNAEQVASASSQIAQGNADLSQRTEAQASSLQQTSATMEELGVAVKHNADHAQQASQLAQNARGMAGRGGSVMQQAVETMQTIHQSSQKIAEIISVIDGIAFQTNILALNAAVEAARAGEQGRGFAVVASEVRSLAQRSADAAKQIKQLIHASVEDVGQGTALVNRAGETMDELVAGIQRVADIMAEINTASAEQTAGVHQVGVAVSQMDQATQQNAALVEQSAAAAESLRTQAQALVQSVNVFRLVQTT